MTNRQRRARQRTDALIAQPTVIYADCARLVDTVARVSRAVTVLEGDEAAAAMLVEILAKPQFAEARRDHRKFAWDIMRVAGALHCHAERVYRELFEKDSPEARRA